MHNLRALISCKPPTHPYAIRNIKGSPIGRTKMMPDGNMDLHKENNIRNDKMCEQIKIIFLIFKFI